MYLTLTRIFKAMAIGVVVAAGLGLAFVFGLYLSVVGASLGGV